MAGDDHIAAEPHVATEPDVCTVRIDSLARRAVLESVHVVGRDVDVGGPELVTGSDDAATIARVDDGIACRDNRTMEHHPRLSAAIYVAGRHGAVLIQEDRRAITPDQE